MGFSLLCLAGSVAEPGLAARVSHGVASPSDTPGYYRQERERLRKWLLRHPRGICTRIGVSRSYCAFPNRWRRVDQADKPLAVVSAPVLCKIDRRGCPWSDFLDFPTPPPSSRGQASQAARQRPGVLFNMLKTSNFSNFLHKNLHILDQVICNIIYINTLRAHARDSKSTWSLRSVWVRPPPPAPLFSTTYGITTPQRT